MKCQLAAILVLLVPIWSQAQNILLEAEHFAELGGWDVADAHRLPNGQMRHGRQRRPAHQRATPPCRHYREINLVGQSTRQRND